jgi:hypothetical protein
MRCVQRSAALVGRYISLPKIQEIPTQIALYSPYVAAVYIWVSAIEGCCAIDVPLDSNA